MTRLLIEVVLIAVALGTGIGLGYAWRAKIAKKLGEVADAAKKV